MYFLLFIVIVSIMEVVDCLFVRKTAVRIEKLEIGYEQNCMTTSLFGSTPPLLMSLFCHCLIKPSLPLGKGRPF